MNATLQSLALTPSECARYKALRLILPSDASPATPSQLAGNGGKKPPGFVRSPETVEREARRKRAQAAQRKAVLHATKPEITRFETSTGILDATCQQIALKRTGGAKEPLGKNCLVGKTGRQILPGGVKPTSLLTAMQIYKASSPLLVSPVRFFEENDVALADIRRCAELEAAALAPKAETP